MEMENLISLSERLQKLLNKTELEAQAIISEAQKKADDTIKEAKEDAEKRRIRAQRRSGLEEFLKEAESEAKVEAEKIKKEYVAKASSIRRIPQTKIDDTASFVVKEVLSE
jgi:V/A-type H+-transporting ATPase subunit G/H